MQKIWKQTLAVVVAAVLMITSMAVAAATETQTHSGRYEVNIQLKQFGSDDLSMGNKALVSPAELVVTSDGKAELEISLVPLTYLNRQGYLGSLKKVTKVNKANKYNYPIEIETLDAKTLEIYDGVYDDFNNPDSQYVDSAVAGKWYAKKISVPVDVNTNGDALTGEDDMLVQVYVPVMESIMAGGGTKFARIVMDYSSLRKIEEVTTAPVTEAPATEQVATEAPTEATTVATEPIATEASATEAAVTTLDRYHLADGEYVVDGRMVKVDRETPSMSDNAINHKILLTVKDGKYKVTMRFNGISIGDKFGYLGKLKYFATGYTSDSYGSPKGDTLDTEILSYQTDDKGERIKDVYGTDYPYEVQFELIPEALDDTFVPLQVFVPVMENISAGSGTQPVFLTLNWNTLQKATAENTKEDATSSTVQPTTVAKGLANKGLTSSTTSGSNAAVQTGQSSAFAVLTAFLLLLLIAVGWIYIYKKSN